MKWPSRTKRLDGSHLTPEERKQALRYGTVGLVSMWFGLIGYLSTGKPIWLLLTIIGVCVLSFLYGYIGAMEDERSAKPDGS